MLNELIIARRIAGVGSAVESEQGARTDHHSAEDWRAFYHALAHRTAFERRFHG